jgi:uncharacterized protein (DUF924 family)
MSEHGSARLQAVLDFWFGAVDAPDYGTPRKAWFEKSDAFDAEIRQHFARDLDVAAAGGFDHLTHTPLGALAVLVMLDQFSRNLFRGQARAFAADAKAREIADRAIRAGHDRQLSPAQRMFMYLPFEHSESLADQNRGVALYESLPPGTYRDEAVDYARRHQVIVARFGRFPHRNAALGRDSTPEEVAFLKEPGSSF